MKTQEIDLEPTWQINCSPLTAVGENTLMRKAVLIAFFMLSMSPMAALADNVSFNSNTSSGSSWSVGGSPFVFGLSSLLTSTQLNSGPLNTTITSGTIGWTTASATLLTSNLVIFSPGGSITVSGDLGDGKGVVALFTGSFQSASLSLLTGGAPNQSAFSASFIAGAIDPDLFAFLGAGALSPDVTGTLSATLNGTFSTSGGGGMVAGDTISLDPATMPEPATLTLFGVGLLALAGIRRRELISRR